MSLPKILFIAENITLAQVTRLKVLAKSLNPDQFEVHFACSAFDEKIFSDCNFKKWPIKTVDKEYVIKSLKRGLRLYTERIIEAYVNEELALFDKVKPDVIVGDFRLSLTISAPFAKIPLVNLINAYWSPYAIRDSFPIPEHPVVKWLGYEMASKYFPRIQPYAFYFFTLPFNRIRKKYGLSEIPGMLELLTFGDATIYPDCPETVTLTEVPKGHSFIGPVIWSPEEVVKVEKQDKPLIYATLGSSGAVEKLPVLIAALKKLPVRAMIATGGRAKEYTINENITLKSFLPGTPLSKISDLVVSNGGSSTGYQALEQGTPVLGIPSNIDQHLATQIIDNTRAGLSIRSDQIKEEKLVNAISRILEDSTFRNNAEIIKRRFCKTDPAKEFKKVVGSIIS